MGKSLRVLGIAAVASVWGCSADDGGSTVATTTLGPEGGAIERDDGFRLVVPPGALKTAVEITVERQQEAPKWALGPSYLLGPEGLQFELPVTLRLPMSSVELPPGSTLLLAVETAPAGSTEYQELGLVAQADDYVETTTTHFSTFFVSNAQPVVLSSDERYSRFIASDGEQVYWTSGGNGQNQLTHTNQGLVFRSPLGGGSVEALSTAQEDPVGIDLDDSHVYWATGGRGVDDPLGQVKSTIMRALKDGSDATLLAEVGYPNALVVDDGSLYWTDNDLGEVQSMPKTGGAVTTLAGGQGYDLEYLALDDSHVYWTTGAGGTVARVPKAGGAVETLAAAQAAPAGLAVSGGKVYWANRGDGWIRAVAVGGGTPEDVRQLDQPAAIAVTGNVLYATDFAGGYVYRWVIGDTNALILAKELAFPKELELAGGKLVWSTEGFTHFEGTVAVFDLAGHGL